MPEYIAPNLSTRWGWDIGEDGWGPDMNLNLLVFDSLIQGAVISRTITAPPGAAQGAIYIIPVGATGEWAGKTGQVAIMLPLGWVYFVPHVGWRFWVIAENLFVRYTGSSWVSETTGSVGGGIFGYATVALMNADLTPPAGSVGAVFSDPDPTNNFPRVAFLRAGGGWTKGFDNLSAIISDVAGLKKTTLEAAVFSGDLYYDNANIFGGNTGTTVKLFVPLSYQRQRGTDIIQTLTLTPASANLTTHVEVSLNFSSGAVRNFVYIDVPTSTIIVVDSSSGSMTMPTIDLDKVIPIGTFVSTGWATPYRIQRTSEVYVPSLVSDNVPIFDPTAGPNGALFVPSMIARRAAVQTTFTPPAFAVIVTAGTNTGNGTLLLSQPDFLTGAAAGDYVVTFTTATAFTVTGPAAYSVAGVVGTRFDGNVKFLISAGGTAFVSGDTFTLKLLAATGLTYKKIPGVASIAAFSSVWLAEKDSLIHVASAASEPMTPLAGGVLVGRLAGNTFFSAYPSVGKLGTGLGRNRFSKGKDPANASRTALAATNVIITITDPAVVALYGAGVKGLRNTHPTSPTAQYGEDMYDQRPGRFFARATVVTDIADTFPNMTVQFKKQGGTIGTGVTLTLEEKLSSTAAIFSLSFPIPNPALFGDPALPWDYWVCGYNTSAGNGSHYTVTAVQMCMGQGEVRWINRQDFPLEQDISIRVRALESASASANPDPLALIGNNIYVVEDRPQFFGFDNCWETRSLVPQFAATMMGLKGRWQGDANPGADEIYNPRPYPAASLELNAKTLADKARLVARKLSDDLPGAVNSKRWYLSRPFNFLKASAQQAGPVKVAIIGDSLNGSTYAIMLQNKLARVGFTPQMIGTMDALGEGRGGWSFAALIGKNNTSGIGDKMIGSADPGAPANWAAYAAMSTTDKTGVNPFLRPSTGGDPSNCIFNGRIADFRNYSTLSAQPDPDVILVGLGVGDINLNSLIGDAVTDIETGLRVMATRLRTAYPNAWILFWFTTVPRANDGDVTVGGGDIRWNTKYVLAIKRFISWNDAFGDAKVDFLSTYLFIDQIGPWSGDAPGANETIISTDPESGTQVVDWIDHTHPDNWGRESMQEQHLAAIAYRCGVPMASGADALTATGTTQATALALTQRFNRMSTVAAGAGVLLPIISAINRGEPIMIRNDGVNPLLVYPDSGHAINGGSANAADTLAAGASRSYVPISATRWST